MRDIKFRAWDKKTKVMIPFTNMWICDEYSSLSFDGPDGSEYVGIDALPGGWHDDSPIESFYEIMQYTGLKDKNGQEIYEGDIVRLKDEIHEIVFGKLGYDGRHNGLTGFGFKDSLDGEGEDTYLELNYYDDPKSLEVIGNVYENPALLEDKN